MTLAAKSILIVAGLYGLVALVVLAALIVAAVGPYSIFANLFIAGLLLGGAIAMFNAASTASKAHRRRQNLSSDRQVQPVYFAPTFEVTLQTEVAHVTRIICPIAFHIDDQGKLSLNAWCFDLDQSCFIKGEEIVGAVDFATGKGIDDLARHLDEEMDQLYSAVPLPKAHK